MAKVEEIKETNIPKDEIGKLSGNCPWCNYDNQDEEKGVTHDKVTEKYEVRNVGHIYQCDSCGKNWNRTDLGKPWTIELERGPSWANEQKIRSLGGRA